MWRKLGIESIESSLWVIRVTRVIRVIRPFGFEVNDKQRGGRGGVAKVCKGNIQMGATSPCKEMLEHREKSSNEKLAELDGKMEAVVGWAQAGYVDFSKFDFTPCHTCL